jgi:hypothetical protein
MKQEALPTGAKLLEQESELDRQFVSHTISPESLKSSTAEVAATQGILRETGGCMQRREFITLISGATAWLASSRQ